MKKLVNGELVDMTPAEIIARQAEEAAWAARVIPTNDEIDLAELNAALVEEGSVLRATIAVMRSEINILRAAITAGVPITLTPRTVPQITAALKAQMRTTP